MIWAVFSGYQPPLELLRQILTQRGCYDRQRKEFQDMEEAMFLATTTLPSVAGNVYFVKIMIMINSDISEGHSLISSFIRVVVIVW